MGDMEAVTLPSVERAFLEQAVTAHGRNWADCAHITATASLASAFASGADRTLAISIASLSDLIIMPGMPLGFDVPAEGFPDHRASPDERKEAIRAWRGEISGRKLVMSIRFDEHLQQALIRRGTEPGVARAVLTGRREIRRTVQGLISAGFSPDQVRPAGLLAREVVEAWADLEVHLPELTATREDLWIALEDYAGDRTQRARHLKARILNALNAAFGPSEQDRLIVHHGFYFFTPPQWALFRLLARTPGVNQLFIIHSDGASTVFDTWSRFFRPSWGLPAPSGTGGSAPATRQASLVLDALEGRRVTVDPIDPGLRVVRFQSPAEFVRAFRSSAGESATEGEVQGREKFFAADDGDVDRFVRRLGGSATGGTVDLAQLPVGVFLLGLHSCIAPRGSGAPSLSLSRETFIDLVGSGFLDLSTKAYRPESLRRAVVQSTDFFNGCSTLDEWIARAEALHALVVSDIARLGARVPGQSDVERLRAGAVNPLRSVPWADVTASEAELVLAAVMATVTLVRELAGAERVTLKSHFAFLRTRLERGMMSLPAEDRQEIEAKLKGMGAGFEQEVDVSGLVDVVQMLLAREADLPIAGMESDENPDDAIGKLRNLDGLGFAKHSGGIHLANLHAGAFPSRMRAVGWPFRHEDLHPFGTAGVQVSKDILRAREEYAPLGDLYLLWLAMNGVDDLSNVTLSWIAKVGDEPLSASPIVGLLTQPGAGFEGLLAQVGGVPVDTSSDPEFRLASLNRPEPMDGILSDGDLEAAVEELPAIAAATSIACPRRFALQWILGPSGSFQPGHLQSMLFGNVAGALEMNEQYGAAEARSVSSDLWRHLSVGERLSSFKKRILYLGTRTPEAWMWFPGASKSKNRPLDDAYRAAFRRELPRVDEVAPVGTGFLPPGLADKDSCKWCPVAPRCNEWVPERD